MTNFEGYIKGHPDTFKLGREAFGNGIFASDGKPRCAELSDSVNNPLKQRIIIPVRRRRVAEAAQDVFVPLQPFDDGELSLYVRCRCIGRLLLPLLRLCRSNARVQASPGVLLLLVLVLLLLLVARYDDRNVRRMLAKNCQPNR